MSLLKQEDSVKWINFFVAVCSILVCYILIVFFGQLREWFDLEARIDHFVLLSQGVGIVMGLGTFIFLRNNPSSAKLMNQVYDELLKVVWPTRETVLQVTIVVIIGVSILSSIFVGVDYLFRQGLELIY